MATIFIAPADLSAAQAQQVLAALNQASSAQQLADRIELPGEPDIGIKLAERLLRARTAAGGQFSTLEQIAAVPLIGPERFTDLCVAVLGLNRQELLGPSRADLLAQLALLQQRLTLLEKQAGAGSLNVQLTLEITPQPAWLGQSLQLVLRATDAEDLPLPDRLFTIEATQGRLHYSYGFAQQVGSALQVRTGADGTARLTLDDQPGEPLTQDQIIALQAALADIDVSADTPELIRTQFDQLASDYDDERNIHLRHALDIYARDGQAYLQRLNAGNAPFEWPILSSVLHAHLHDSDAHHRVTATAVCIATWKNWVPAWFSFLHDWLAARSGLAEAFIKARRPATSGDRLIDNILGEAHSFVASQKGLAAELVSQHVVGDAVTRFLSTGITDLGDEIKQELFPSLEIASEQIRAGNRGTLSLVSETRQVISKDVAKEIANIGRINTGVLTEVMGMRDEVAREAAGLADKLNVFDQNYGSFTNQYATFSTQYGSFNNQFSTFSTNYTAFNIDYARFNLDKTKVGTQIVQFNTDLAGFQSQRVQLTTDLSTLKTDVAGINVKLNTRPTGGGT
jgi:hypothetical protein